MQDLQTYKNNVNSGKVKEKKWPIGCKTKVFKKKEKIEKNSCIDWRKCTIFHK